MMAAQMEVEEMRKLGTIDTDTTDGDYGSLTFSVPYQEGIHYYLLEQDDVETDNNNRATSAILIRCDYVHSHFAACIVNYSKTSIWTYSITQSSSTDYFIKNDDGTFKVMGATGFRFKLPITYHMYHLKEGIA